MVKKCMLVNFVCVCKASSFTHSIERLSKYNLSIPMHFGLLCYLTCSDVSKKKNCVLFNRAYFEMNKYIYKSFYEIH